MMSNEMHEWPFDSAPGDEIEEERPPQHLAEKWEREEQEEVGAVICPNCGKQNRKDALECIYCETKLIVDAGFLSWLSYLTTKSFWGFALFVLFLIIISWIFIVLY
jgi:hypothetical protein